MKNKIGIALFALYIIQDFFSLKLDFLESWQLNETHKTWTGIFLFLLILSQWILSVIRIKIKELNSKKELFTIIHKWVGIILPLIFFFHSTHIGHGILSLLSFVLLTNIGINLLSTKSFLNKNPKYYKWWLVSHIFLSIAIVGFSLIHIWIVFFYN